MRKCPYCAELVQDTAIKCKHCGEYLGPMGGQGPEKPAPPKKKPVWDVVLLTLVLLAILGFGGWRFHRYLLPEKAAPTPTPPPVKTVPPTPAATAATPTPKPLPPRSLKLVGKKDIGVGYDLTAEGPDASKVKHLLAVAAFNLCFDKYGTENAFQELKRGLGGPVLNTVLKDLDFKTLKSDERGVIIQAELNVEMVQSGLQAQGLSFHPLTVTFEVTRNDTDLDPDRLLSAFQETFTKESSYYFTNDQSTKSSFLFFTSQGNLSEEINRTSFKAGGEEFQAAVDQIEDFGGNPFGGKSLIYKLSIGP